MPPDQLSTVAAEAATLYEQGIALLVRGRSAAAIPLLRGAVAIDEHFAIANVALAVAEAEVGNLDESRTAIERSTRERGISRRERQHIAVIALALADEMSRASALGREHLQEFAADVLVIHVLAVRGADIADLCPDDPCREDPREVGHEPVGLCCGGEAVGPEQIGRCADVGRI